MDAIKQAAAYKALDQAKSRRKKKRAVAEILNIKFQSPSYRAGLFKRQWDKHHTV
jgi:hypothetical protein